MHKKMFTSDENSFYITGILVQTNWHISGHSSSNFYYEICASKVRSKSSEFSSEETSPTSFLMISVSILFAKCNKIFLLINLFT